MSDSSTHWRDVYSRLAVTEVSWFQAHPEFSLELITAAGVRADEPIIDIGGGASVLADRLLERGHHDITVLDIAAEALANSQRRLGEHAAEVAWVAANLLTWQPPRRYRLWHDRAVFHFLTNAVDRDRYRQMLEAALAPGGHVVIGTFAEDGPTRCSNLPTARYSSEELAAQFPGLQTVRTGREEHRTPAGNIQTFSWVLLSAPPDQPVL